MASKELEITKDKVLKASEKCPQAKEVLKELFSEAFEEKWRDISKETEWWLREDGVLEIKHDGICRGHHCIGREFYWVDDEYKEEIEGRNLRILKKN